MLSPILQPFPYIQTINLYLRVPIIKKEIVEIITEYLATASAFDNYTQLAFPPINKSCVKTLRGLDYKIGDAT